MKQISRRSCEDDVINVEEQVGDLTALFVNKERGVRDRSNEAEGADVVGEALVPRPRCLLKSVQGLLQQADMIRRTRIDETRRLLAVDRLL